MLPPRNIVDLAQFQPHPHPDNNDPKDNAPDGMMRLTISFNPNNVPLSAAAQWKEDGVAGYAILECYANGNIKLDDRDVERIAQRCVELFQKRRKKRPAGE